MIRPVELGDLPLTLDRIGEVALGEAPVTLTPKGTERVKRGSDAIEKMLSKESESHYGINTGFGSLKDVRISRAELEELQVNLIRSTCVGTGPLLAPPVVRAMMLLRAHTLALGHSGVRPELIELLAGMLNRDVLPLIPSQGSVGASGDLAPLAHMALTLLGEGEVLARGKRIEARTALEQADLKPLRPAPKEGLALINGTQMICAVGTLALLRAESAMKNVDLAAAMSLEATLGSARAFDERVHKLRPHPGQGASAANLRALLAESAICESHRDCARVQDAYSIRCAPQVHGAARDMLRYVREVLTREVNSVVDNPILFPEEGETISAGNFHGQPVATALDAMALALTSTASISERRSFRILSPNLSELPAGLTKKPGLHSGLMMLQVTAAALVNECKTFSHPASVDSIPTWSDQEDHVSMGAWAARKAEQVVDALERVIAVELLCAAQGLEFRKPLRPGKGVEAGYKAIRKEIPAMDGDRYLASDLDRAGILVREGTLLAAVEKAVGPLT